MSLSRGTKLGPYEIVAPLGAGGMGEVYCARDTRLNRTVAIKILPANISTDPVAKQRFEREAKTISGLNHPSICALYDVGSQDAEKGAFTTFSTCCATGYLRHRSLPEVPQPDRTAHFPCI